MFSNGTNRKRPLDIQKQHVKAAAIPNITPDRSVVPRKVAVKPKQRQHSSRNSPNTSSISASSSRAGSKQQSALPAPTRIDFGLEDSDSDEGVKTLAKKLKTEHQHNRDLDRQIRCKDAFSPDEVSEPLMVHAADIPSLDTTTKYESAIHGLPESFALELEYPSSLRRERYKLIKPIHDPHAFQAVSDIVEVMHKVSTYYLPKTAQSLFVNETVGFPQRFQRAVNKKTVDDIEKVVEEYNTMLKDLREDGTIARVLDGWSSLPPTLVERILNQTYSRTVSPNLKVLRRYQAGTDNVYGELLPRFVSCILRQDLNMDSSKVFIDLGSGVGNVVLQAALEIGCECWGCEMMPDYCKVADLQQSEFVARCRLWGLTLGKIYLERGNFLENLSIKETLRRADAILVNNQVFTPELNEALTTLFLDLKDGCRVVSLKSFVPSDHKITSRNLNSPYNVLSVEKKRYFSNCVSWTNEGGSYFVSTKNSKRIKRFLEKQLS